MPDNVSRRKVLLIILAVVVGIIAYNVAPPDIEPGDYEVEVVVSAPSINAVIRFNMSLVSSGENEYDTFIVEGDSTNISILVSTTTVVEPQSKIKIVLTAEGETIGAEYITASIWNDKGFAVTTRPTKKTGQVFTIEYQPLVRSKSAVLILAVVAVLWFSEGISLVATSIMIPVLIVLANIRTPQEALMPFFDPAVALIFGGFLIGRALSKYELDKRLALMILSRSSGTGSGLLLTVMGVTAFLSMWISNTASAAIMIPIALAVISRIQSEETRSKYGKVLVLGVAYAATLGGVASLVGSPPNPLAATYINSFLGVQFSFMSWIPFGLPVVLIMLPITWQWLMVRFKLPKCIDEMQDLKDISEKEYLKLGPMPRNQQLVVVIFISVIVLWFTENLPDFIANVIGWSGHGISSAIVALMGGLALMVLGLLDEKDVSSEISWSSLLILGSGIALGGAMIDTGVSAFLAQQMSGLGILPPILIIVVVGTLAVLITMVASNTGAAVILIPIAIPLATALGMDPLLLTMVIAIAVSMDFALPTGTPPSTIAYSTGRIEMDEMVTTGLVVDFIAILVLTLGVVFIWALLGLVTI
ncbi:MAG: DASS family sodium-coupled anion symporter [Candidatus Thorarchaeota archaeon]